MFSYCTEVLHLSESAAYARIEVARAVRRTPRLLPCLADGSLSLTTIRRLAPVLTPDNCDRLIAEARHKTSREVEALVARERPRPDAPPTIRRCPERTEHVAKRVAGEMEVPADGLALGHGVGHTLGEWLGEGLGLAPVASGSNRDRARPSIQPLAPERHRVQFTASGEMRERIERLQDLLRHRIPDGDLAAVIDTALIELLQKLERHKCGAPSPRGARRARQEAGLARHAETVTAMATPATAPRNDIAPAPSHRAQRPRTIPCAVRRVVWRRDEGRCAFVSEGGKRCSATGFVEFHHVDPFARGGGSAVTNIALRCRAHNGYEADRAGLGRRVH